MSEDQTEQIAKQHVGEAIVYQNSWEEAVQCKIHEYRYKDCNRYTKQYSMPAVAQRVARLEVLNFLLHNLVNKPIDFQQVDEFIENDMIPSSLRIRLLEMLREYKTQKTVSLWEKEISQANDNRIRLSEY